MNIGAFQFDNLAAFLSMDGHGPYVWSAYAISAVVILYLVVIPLRRQRKLIIDEKKRMLDES
jgi:heme exporter protein D